MNPAAFPPSFAASPLSYGFALFSLTLITSLSLAQLLHYMFEARARRAMQVRALNLVSCPMPVFAAANVYRMVVSGFLMTVMFGAAPDVLFLMFWGEVSDHTIDTILIIDRVFDGLTLLPFAFASFLSAWSSQVLPQQLTKAAEIPLARPTWRMMREHLRIVWLVMAIALMVTIGKASA